MRRRAARRRSERCVTRTPSISDASGSLRRASIPRLDNLAATNTTSAARCERNGFSTTHRCQRKALYTLRNPFRPLSIVKLPSSVAVSLIQ